MGAAQPQEVATRVARQVTELRFRDFFRLPVGPTGRYISDTLRLADGQTVRLVGYMVQQESAAPGRVNRKIKRHVFVPTGTGSPALGGTSMSFWGSVGLASRTLCSRSATA